MIDNRLADYNQLKRSIDRLRDEVGDANLEAEKGIVLKGSAAYMDFLQEVTGESRPALENLIDECASFLRHDTALKMKLSELAQHAGAGVATGEIRVHSYTLFVMVRALKPSRFLETGVANGKSSLMILKAMQSSRAGKLISVDAATLEADGADRHKAPGAQVGWLVPDELRDRWDLRLGLSGEVLPRIPAAEGLDIFMHDSLSSYENMMFEYGEARRLLKTGGLLISDDIETCSAFDEFAGRYGQNVRCFGTLGVMTLRQPSS